MINKFRGDEAVLAPGLDELTRRTGVPVPVSALATRTCGWTPRTRWRSGPGGGPAAADGTALRVAVVRLPGVSNVTDVDALAAEPGVDVRLTTDPDVVADADLAVLPGTRATVSDLAGCGGTAWPTPWSTEPGGRAGAGDLRRLPDAGAPDLGRAGDGHRAGDRARPAARHGHLPGREDAGAAHRGLARAPGVGVRDPPRGGGGRTTAEPFLDGCRAGAVWGTMWHGALENDGFRRAWLSEIAATTGSPWRPADGAPAHADRRETMIDTLADAIETHVDLDVLLAGTVVCRDRRGLVIGIGSGQPGAPDRGGGRGAEPGRRVPGRRQGQPPSTTWSRCARSCARR